MIHLINDPTPWTTVREHLANIAADDHYRAICQAEHERWKARDATFQKAYQRQIKRQQKVTAMWSDANQ